MLLLWLLLLLRQAEVNLVFNQLLFDLEAEVFGYFKDWAASTVLDKMFKRVYEARRGWGHFIPGRRRYEVRCPIEIDEILVGWRVANRYAYARSTLILLPSSSCLYIDIFSVCRRGKHRCRVVENMVVQDGEKKHWFRRVPYRLIAVFLINVLIPLYF